MLLKRLHTPHPDDDKGLKAPILSGVVIKRISGDGKQKFSTKLVKTGQSERWLTLTKDKIIIHDKNNGDAVFNILRVPGRYCCHDGVKLVDDQTGIAAREYVAEKHPGKKSPDAQNPSGYEMINYYDCELEVSRG